MLTPARAGTPRSADRDRRARRAAARAIAITALALLPAGCATTPRGAPPGTTAAPPRGALRPAAGYERRTDELTAVDASALAGRRIAIDPGHGGFFRGALGVDGLTEAEVNLGVALHLRGLLEARGATVLLTRGDDRDFLTPADSSLRADLVERSRIANAWGPDLFLSIHHNADARGAHDVNETQTYYKLGDDGPSLEAAEDVHRFLVRNLGIAKHRIVPGNYFVLRSSAAPALLTESSYLTNPDVEKKLALAAKQRLEAEALFLGIAKYFARRAPVVDWMTGVGDQEGAGDSLVYTGPAPRLLAHVTGTFDEADLRLDGARVSPLIRAEHVDWSPSVPLPAGRHEAVLRVRLAGLATSRERRLAFTIRRPVASIAVDEFPPRPSRTSSSPRRPDRPLSCFGLRLELRDRFGLVVPDSVPVRVRLLGRALAPAETLLTARDGVAWGYFVVTPPPGRLAPERLAMEAVCERPGQAGRRAGFRQKFEVQLASDGWSLERAWLMPAGVPLENAPGTRESAKTVDWLNRDGFTWALRGGPLDLTWPRLPGYRRWDADSFAGHRFVPLCGGALQGRRITLDPAGGGDDAAGTGASGTRAANLNLEVARALAAMLRAAGAEVKLTREGDYALSDVERVQLSEGFVADRFLRIGHAAEPPMLGYYFSSPAGRHWAESAASTFAALGVRSPRTAEDAQYPLQQTSCPALYASPARIDDRAEEERLLSPGALRAEAYALYLALAREWAPDADWPADSLEVRDPAGRPLPAAPVTLGEALVLETDALGRVRFARTEPGPMSVRVEDARLRVHAVLLESQRGLILTGPSGR